jgi:hypothetical protein
MLHCTTAKYINDSAKWSWINAPQKNLKPESLRVAFVALLSQSSRVWPPKCRTTNRPILCSKKAYAVSFKSVCLLSGTHITRLQSRVEKNATAAAMRNARDILAFQLQSAWASYGKTAKSQKRGKETSLTNELELVTLKLKVQ